MSGFDDVDGSAKLRRDLLEHLRDGGRLAVVKAPPGSGKTYTLIEVLSALVGDGMRVAVSAQTNSQADDICKRWASDHPHIPVTRFTSRGLKADATFPSSVSWIADKAQLSMGPGITVATTAKWSLTDVAAPYDLIAIDEAWQMSWADLMQCALISERFLMIGDPGQIPPVVTIDVRRWETSPRAPHEAAPEVVMADPNLSGTRFVGSLPTCRRLPRESVDFVKPFYDFDFQAFAEPGARRLEGDLPAPWLSPLGEGRPLVLTVPTPAHGPPIEVDQEVAAATSGVVEHLLSGSVHAVIDGEKAVLKAEDIGISSTHRVMNAALISALGERASKVRVDTPERWQGLERPVMIAVHPLSGVTEPSAFDLETGRLCVMASRHQAAMILLARDHVGETLRDYVPSAEQAPGRPDRVGRGHDAHLRFWGQLEQAGCVVPLT